MEGGKKELRKRMCDALVVNGLVHGCGCCNVLFPDPVGAQMSKSLLISAIGMVNI